MTDSCWRNLVDAIKQRVDIVQVIGSHVQLNQHNKALCPFHDDKKPSLSVNPKGQYFHCFGCGVGGDVIRFLELYERKPFVEVMRMLAAEAGIELPDFGPETGDKLRADRLREDILSATASYYHQKLTPEARAYLMEKRGITDETVSKFQIGYAVSGLRDHLLKERGFPVEACIEAGVLKKIANGTVRDYFYKRLIFPNLRRGRVVHLTGRVLDDHGPKYLHLPGKLRCLFNEDALLENEVVIAEGIPDCMAATQLGFASVGVLGTSHFREEFRPRFDRCETVYVSLDGDNAGREAALRIGEILADKALIVSLPEGSDLNDYLLQNSGDEFQELLNSAKPYFDVRIEAIKALPENKHLVAVREFLPALEGLDEFTRSHYTGIIKKEFGLTKRTINTGITSKPEEAGGQRVSSEKEPIGPDYTEAEKQHALELLRDPNLIEKLADTAEKLGCVGEENNKIIIYMTLASRILDDPISLIVKGDSSGGKSFLVEKISQFFPESEILTFTTITPKALYHRQGSLSHKALIVLERPGAEESDYSIRSLQSEKKLIISQSVKDPDTGKWVTEDHKVPGPVAYIETTTKSHLHSENETRCFDIFIDDSEKQTSLIQEAQRKKYRDPTNSADVDLRTWVVAQQLLKAYPVRIPYIDKITFPQKPLRVRRDFPRFLTFIKISAILHQYQREKQQIGNLKWVVASIEDYAIAYGLAIAILQQTIKQIAPNAEELIHSVKQYIEKSDSKGFTRRQIAEHAKLDIKTVTKYLTECTDQGYTEIKAGGSGKAFEYAFIRLPNENDNLLISPDKLREIVRVDEQSKVGKPSQNQVGQVNSEDSNNLGPPVQPNHGNVGQKAET